MGLTPTGVAIGPVNRPEEEFTVQNNTACLPVIVWPPEVLKLEAGERPKIAPPLVVITSCEIG